MADHQTGLCYFYSILHIGPGEFTFSETHATDEAKKVVNSVTDNTTWKKLGSLSVTAKGTFKGIYEVQSTLSYALEKTTSHTIMNVVGDSFHQSFSKTNSQRYFPPNSQSLVVSQTTCQAITFDNETKVHYIPIFVIIRQITPEEILQPLINPQVFATALQWSVSTTIKNVKPLKLSTKGASEIVPVLKGEFLNNDASNWKGTLSNIRCDLKNKVIDAYVDCRSAGGTRICFNVKLDLKNKKMTRTNHSNGAANQYSDLQLSPSGTTLIRSNYTSERYIFDQNLRPIFVV
mmetsp:Transcript_16235/g.22492  ORF Transcript_16235/g.22492 Transcript_16235/m.22492 type:complete len:290 (-) Transcript_16235:264-1133(-)|eukprot:CAMPEP_0201476986 /NCGR_PEP_ID=MMETSP0151_2-20130828/2111_1 /ASSEMBLY_ACC=CAM_ASM_000257 /TAXON_ID=200890 /ORGANISM="Paramoeba atlantica, Strain 621/1 / CCAP 1560/9" /LENGTH=289 /DNA_ID=CAMNT_0047857571 /DNA_START=33 /DNA_END=902 /DNA_ORIENTATION=+